MAQESQKHMVQGPWKEANQLIKQRKFSSAIPLLEKAIQKGKELKALDQQQG